MTLQHWTVAEGTLSAIGKLCRGALDDKYRFALDQTFAALSVGGVVDTVGACPVEPAVPQSLVEQAAAAITDHFQRVTIPVIPQVRPMFSPGTPATDSTSVNPKPRYAYDPSCGRTLRMQAASCADFLDFRIVAATPEDAGLLNQLLEEIRPLVLKIRENGILNELTLCALAPGVSPMSAWSFGTG